mmetsp:Transcript_46497/g.107755  ORF Transcript_46497/g.107755 Transcript_46497/m.107755 type:complete len:157 (+) Transcript_46497:114-584(+)
MTKRKHSEHGRKGPHHKISRAASGVTPPAEPLSAPKTNTPADALRTQPKRHAERLRRARALLGPSYRCAAVCRSKAPVSATTSAKKGLVRGAAECTGAACGGGGCNCGGPAGYVLGDEKRYGSNTQCASKRTPGNGLMRGHKSSTQYRSCSSVTFP